MPIQFPSNPTVNQTYVYNGTTWTWLGNLWSKAGAGVSSGGGGATVTVSNAAPSSPTTGALWIDSEYGDLNAYFSNAWVVIGSGGGSPSQPTITSITGTIKSGYSSTLVIYGNYFGLSAVTVRFSFGTIADVTVTPTSSTQLTVAVPASIYGLIENTVGNISVIDSYSRQSNGYPMTTQIEYDGATQARAAPHASYIRSLGITTTGYYWIKPAGTSTAYQVHCDMTNSGGGWMLMSFCGTDINNGAHVENAYTGSAFNMSSNATSITNTVQASGTAGNMGQTFIDALVKNGRGRGIAVFRIHDAGTTWKNWYFVADSNAAYNPVATRVATNSEAANTWLKTCYPTYTADSGNNGAGTASGSAVTYGGESWCTYPGNMNTVADNWGYAIKYNYTDAVGTGYAVYKSCHSNNWNRAGSFWLKIV
jgi:hypothetical protein